MKFDKILLLQQNALGDVVLSTGIVRAVREQFPDSHIAFLVSPDTAALVDLPFVDEIVPYTKGMPMLPVIRRLWHYDVAICLDFKYRSAVIPFLARIPVRAGIAHKRKLFLTHAVDRHPDSEKMYFTRHLADVMERSIGLKLAGDVTQLGVAAATAADLAAVDALLPRIHGGRLRVAVAPFSSTRMKDWPVESYAEFMQRLAQEQAVEFVLLGGPADREKEFPLSGPVTDLRDCLPLTATAEALRRVDYFVGSCSAPLHIAAAVGCPALAFYGPTSPAKWAPQHRCIHLEHVQPCAPCDRIGYGTPCQGHNVCMQQITVDEAMDAFHQLIGEN